VAANTLDVSDQIAHVWVTLEVDAPDEGGTVRATTYDANWELVLADGRWLLQGALVKARTP
ncbi:MAG: hypothetical protein GX605_12060, partial [Chloroflexi bacterium]|nr:hypothetical protein [Chloroflexota bacterium]